jgi:DNA mismatch repair protein MSH3
MRDSIIAFGKLDVFLSFAAFASQPGYVQPVYDLIDEKSSEGIIIKGARHPMVEQFLEKQGKSFVPNDIELGMNFGKQRCKVVTGPNMGGKSSYVRMTALICLLGQLGCHVPALEAKLIVFDNIFTRMGAGDDLASGTSTFMVELYRTSSILERVTPRSLVILDELGRGTSTHDGMAIAKATLNYFIENIGCTILFVTHFLSVSDMVSSEERFKDIASNVHMASMNEKFNFIDENSLLKKRKSDSGVDVDEEDNDNLGQQSSLDSITFLYKVVKGAASSSYGLNVARLVGLDSEIIEIARAKACWMKSI